MKFNTAIIDFDPLIYRAGHAIQKLNKETGILELEPITVGYYNIRSMIKKLFRGVGTNNFIGYVSGGDRSNYRFLLDPTYKSNRKESQKPHYYNELHNYLVTKFKANPVFGQEADDACSIKHCELNRLGWNKDTYGSVVCSNDKDFNNIPGWHYNYVKDELFYVTEFESLQHFYLQILTGDSADAIPRIKFRWRQKQAEADLYNACDTEVELFERVLREVMNILELYYEDAYNLILKRGQLLWLRREENELWKPPLEMF